MIIYYKKGRGFTLIMVDHHWTKDFKDEQYYIRVTDKKVTFGNVFEGGRTGLEWECSLAEFLREEHEVNLRIKEIFSDFTYEEVKLLARAKQNE